MKKKLKIALTLAAILLVFVACDNSNSTKKESSAKDWKKIEESGKLVVGVDDTFVPMGFRDKDGNIVGFDIDLAKAVAEELGLKAEIQPIDWKMKESELNRGSIDLIWNGYTVTDERKEKVSFSKAYLKNEQVIVTMKKNNITSYEGLKDKSLGAQEGSSGVEALESKPKVLLDLISNQTPELYASFSEAFLDLESGRIAGLVVDSVYAEYYVSHKGKSDEYTILPSEFEEEDYAIGIRKGDSETVEKINTALKKLYENGKTTEISQKWFGEDKVVPQN